MLFAFVFFACGRSGQLEHESKGATNGQAIDGSGSFESHGVVSSEGSKTVRERQASSNQYFDWQAAHLGSARRGTCQILNAWSTRGSCIVNSETNFFFQSAQEAQEAQAMPLLIVLWIAMLNAFKPCHSSSARAREMKVAPKQRFLTKSDAARYAGRSLSTVNRWIKLGLPRINTPSGGVLVDRSVLDSWLKSNEVSAS